MTSLSSISMKSGNSPSTPLVESAEKISSTSPIHQLPEEIIQLIFSYLNPRELASNSQVSRRWHHLSSDPHLWNAFDLKKTFPHLSIFDASDWEKHFGLKLKDEPPIDKRTLFPILKQFASLPIEKLLEKNEGEHIKKEAGVTLLTIPKGLTLKKLIEMAKKEGKVKFRYISDRVLEEIGDIEADKSYRILITNNILVGSRGKSVAEQKILVEKTFGNERPNTLTTLALLVTTFMSKEKRLYSDDPWTFTRGPEFIDAKYPVVIGGFSYGGLDVGNGQYNDDYDDFGAAAFRRV